MRTQTGTSSFTWPSDPACILRANDFLRKAIGCEKLRKNIDIAKNTATLLQFYCTSTDLLNTTLLNTNHSIMNKSVHWRLWVSKVQSSFSMFGLQLQPIVKSQLRSFTGPENSYKAIRVSQFKVGSLAFSARPNVWFGRTCLTELSKLFGLILLTRLFLGQH